MATLKGLTRDKVSPSYRGSFMIDTVRGVLRVRKWPRKRGTPKSALQRWWNEWFRQANRLAKYVDGASAARAIEITKDSGMYPRDILLAAMRGRLYTWQDQYGKKWHSMAATQDISNSLDVLAQTVSSVLVRATDRWRAALPEEPASGLVLSSQGAGLPPVWGASGSGVITSALGGTPITVDDTLNAYVFDVTTYAFLDVLLKDIVFAASDLARMRFSTDGGVTYRSGGTDYYYTVFDPGGSSSGPWSSANVSPYASADEHNCIIRVASLRVNAAYILSDASLDTGPFSRRTIRANFAGPVTHIKLYSNAGNNFKTGVIDVTGVTAA